MICPVRCFTCGRVIADKIKYFQRKRQELLGSKTAAPILDSGVQEEERVMGALLDELELTLMCCRRHLLTQVDLIDII
ncbi:DNA-directed RNA polymerase subunit N [Tetrabaena socialis]|uniref:DNA-directed RNA polymerases I, II, and III subunit RPABC5 n=1 Tax=Tetrabaena socialis TaxID=47790 RepID=A0A2J7ZIN4_9CHLO|nr:DNA-directed RNA polymerase subunit N [Tetrabaena socialis]PNH01284.1 DNA-directed RNA polymerase subunit N [Tetrabaena socialis]PNH01474.1 DNA-directed RNA polymerase subunit N [Tetrabaena socialis]|eukprot:PNH00129.1 DNA-directed RNA polymerase subunit N [Tetrabaena socialis]